MVQKVSGWVTFKFSLPKQDSDKTNHKELELAFHNRAYAHSNIIPLQILQQKSPQIIFCLVAEEIQLGRTYIFLLAQL